MKIIFKKVYNGNSFYSENMIISFLSKLVDFWTKKSTILNKKKDETPKPN